MRIAATREAATARPALSPVHGVEQAVDIHEPRPESPSDRHRPRVPEHPSVKGPDPLTPRASPSIRMLAQRLGGAEIPVARDDIGRKLIRLGPDKLADRLDGSTRQVCGRVIGREDEHLHLSSPVPTSAYARTTSLNFWPVCSRLKVRMTRFRERWRRSLATPASDRTRPSASDSASTSPMSTRIPAGGSPSAKRAPSVLVLTIGAPAAMASRIAIPRPSSAEDETKTAASWSRATSSSCGTSLANETAPCRPSCCTNRTSDSRGSPRPAMINLNGADEESLTVLNALIRVPKSFRGSPRRPTATTRFETSPLRSPA